MRKRIIAAVGLLLIGALAVWTYSSRIQSSETAGNDGKSSTLRVAVLLPLTGPGASGAAYSQKGFELATQQIREEYGGQLELIYRDTQTNPKTAVSIFRELSTGDLPKVTIMQLSSVTRAIKPMLSKNTLGIASGVAVPDIAAPDEYLFRVFPSSEGIGDAAASHAMERQKETAAVVYVNDDYGQGSLQSFRKSFEAGGGTVVSAEPFTLTQNSFRTQWEKILEDSPESLWITGYGPGYLTVLNQLREQGYEGLIMTDWSLSDPQYFEATEGVQEGTVVVMPESTGIIERLYEKQYDGEPSVVNVGYAYDALMMVWRAYEASDGSVASMAEEFARIEGYKGAMGTLSVRLSGSTTTNFQLMVVSDQQLQPLEQQTNASDSTLVRGDI